MAGKIQVIVGGQFGSEGKGHAAAELAKREGQMLAIRTGGPNAGHTVVHGRTYKLRQLPVAMVVNPKAVPAIAARSLVQLDLVEEEIKELTRAEASVPTVMIDERATVLEHAHIAVEQQDPALGWGSTQKGIGAARSDRVHRTARTMRDIPAWPAGTALSEVDVLAEAYLHTGYTVQVEAAQGYGLGLHTGFYPKTTSADCRAIDALADVGISPWAFPDSSLEVWVVVRPFPIRVAGDSGPLENEASWEDLGLPEERTTVTNKVRRVGGWDPALVREAVRANGQPNVRLWMNMADHVFPWLGGKTDMGMLNRNEKQQLNHWIARVIGQVGAPIHALGTGPDTAIFLGGY